MNRVTLMLLEDVRADLARKILGEADGAAGNETPDQHKARTGRCPPGYSSDESGKCVKKDGAPAPAAPAAKPKAPAKAGGKGGEKPSKEKPGGAKPHGAPAPPLERKPLKNRVGAEHMLTDEEYEEKRKKAGGRLPQGAQLKPEMVKKLEALGCNKWPAAHVPPSGLSVNIEGDDIDFRAIMSWRDKRNKLQQAYTEVFEKRNAKEKFVRVSKMLPKILKISNGLLKKAQEGNDPAAVALVIAHTGLRVGGEESRKTHNHYGIRSMEARHVTFDEKGAHINYEGKAGAENKATITDPDVINELKKRVKGKKPNEPIFKAREKEVREAVPFGFHPKDFRTAVATSVADKTLASSAPPPPFTGDEAKDRKLLLGAIKKASHAAATSISNTPDVALKSYIHPEVLNQWMDRIKAPAAARGKVA